jgi:hypothetical protein
VFRSEFHFEPLPYAGNLQVCLRMQSADLLTQKLVSELSRPFRNLAVVGAWGGLAGEDISPEQSGMTLVTAAQPIGQSELLWGFEVDDIDPGALLVIENLAQHLHASTARIAALRIYGSLTGRKPHDDLRLPTYFEPLPFEFDYDVQTAQALVDVTFEERQNVERLEPFRAAWDAWEGVAIEGGFADEVYPAAQASLGIEDELKITSTGLGAAYEDVAIADAGFYCLVNMVHKLHHGGVLLSSVVIE